MNKMTKQHSAYAVRSMTPQADGCKRWTVLKTNDGEVTIYEVSEQNSPYPPINCSCMAGSKSKPCRHKKMVLLFREQNAIDSGRLYIYDTDEWIDAVNPEEEI